MIQLMLNWSLLLYIWFFFPTKVVPIVIISFILGFLSQWNFLLSTILCGDFPEHGVTGMIYTMSASSSNLGRNKFIHTAILKIVPWRTMAIIGLGLQLILILVFTPKMIDLI
jgi:ABC-type maltose transport system permease subunit